MLIDTHVVSHVIVDNNHNMNITTHSLYDDVY